MTAKSKISRTQGIVFSLIPLTVLVLTFEVALRLLPVELDVKALSVETSDSFEVKMFESHFESGHFVRDGVTFWAPRPGTAPFNALGYRGEELAAAKTPGELRILAVGDSNTLGNLRISWANEIARTPEAEALAKGEVTVVNAGAYGYTSFQGKHHLRRFLEYRPDVVLISFGGNDPTPNAVADKDYVAYQPHPIYRWFDGKSAIVDAIEYLAVQWGRSRRPPPAPSTPGELVSRVSLDDYERNLVDMIETARDAGAVPILLTRPIVYAYQRPDSASPMKSYYHKTLEVAREQDAGLIDVHLMAGTSWVLFDDHSHFNDRGHRLIASYVATALGDLLVGRDYDSEALRFKPGTAGERATDAVKGVVNVWATLERNLERLSENRPDVELEPGYQADFSAGPDGWTTTMLPSKLRDRPPEIRDGALCFSGDGDKTPTVMTLSREGLGLARDLPHLVWVEGESSSDFSIRLFWKTRAGAAFEEESSVSDVFYGDRGTPIRFFHVLPAGTEGVRIDAYTLRWQAPICFTRVELMSLTIPDAGQHAER